MGYRALKEKTENKQKRLKRAVLCIFVVLLLALTIFSFFVPPESWKYYFKEPKISERKDGELRMHFLDVGQGDCTLIELPDGEILLVDGGSDDTWTKKQVLRYLNALDIDVIDHLVISHTDADHCGSLEEVLRYKKVVNAYLPYTSSISWGVEYGEVYAAIVEKKCNRYDASRSIDLSNRTGENGYTLRFLYPYAAEAVNDVASLEGASSAFWLDYQGTSALFYGDSDEDVEETLLKEEKMGLLAPLGVTLSSTEILKVAHHGSNSSSSADFLAGLGVEKAIISCGAKNPYGHPASGTLERLEAVGAELWRTDTQGHIMITVKKDGSYQVESVKS